MMQDVSCLYHSVFFPREFSDKLMHAYIPQAWKEASAGWCKATAFRVNRWGWSLQVLHFSSSRRGFARRAHGELVRS